MAAPSINGTTPATERQAAARRAYLDSVDAGAPLSGAELGRRFDRSPRWGCDRVTEAAAGGNGRRPAGDRHADGNNDPLDPGPPTPAPSPAAADRHADSGGRHAESLATERTGMPATTQQPGPSWMDTSITLIVAVVAALASYGHMYEVALTAGEPLWIARAFPITIDGLVLAALRRGEHGRTWLLLGLAVSIAANVIAHFPELTHPTVAEAAVFGIADARWIEAVTAAVVLRDGAAATPDDLLAHARSRLAGYKAPKHIVIVDQLPKNPSGKILKRELRERYAHLADESPAAT